jgi:hypothetical protein
MYGLDMTQDARYARLIAAIAVVLCDLQPPTRGVQCADGIGVAEGVSVGEKRER